MAISKGSPQSLSLWHLQVSTSLLLTVLLGNCVLLLVAVLLGDCVLLLVAVLLGDSVLFLLYSVANTNKFINNILLYKLHSGHTYLILCCAG